MYTRLSKLIAVPTHNAVKNFSCTSQRNYKVTIVGAAGGIGQTVSLLLKMDPLVTQLVCQDIAPGVCGVAVDLSHIDNQTGVCAYKGLEKLPDALKDADVVVVPAGLPRKIDQTRDDLFGANAGMICQLGRAMAKSCPQALCCIITNPINSMVPLLSEILKQENAHDPRRIFGVTTLDLVRSSTFVGEINGVDPRTVYVPVICGHSLWTIIPVLSHSKPRLELTNQKKIEELFKRIQAAGHEVAVAKANFGTATLTMGFAAARMVNSLLRALSGEPNVEECAFVCSNVTEASYFATPLLLGRCGIEKNLGIPSLNAFEKEQLKSAMPHLLKNIKKGVDYAKEQSRHSQKK